MQNDRYDNIALIIFMTISAYVYIYIYIYIYAIRIVVDMYNNICGT